MSLVAKSCGLLYCVDKKLYICTPEKLRKTSSKIPP